MRVRPSFGQLAICALLFLLAALPAGAATLALGADVTYQLTTVWIPATAYGLTLIAAFGKNQK